MDFNGLLIILPLNFLGGATLYIETCLTKSFKSKSSTPKVTVIKEGETEKIEPTGGDGSLETTGHLGDVMKESMRIAYTVAKSFILKKIPDNDFFEHAHIHVHVPEVDF